MKFADWLLQEEVKASLPYSVLKGGMDDIMRFDLRLGRYKDFPHGIDYIDDLPQNFINMLFSKQSMHSGEAILQILKQYPQIAVSEIIPVKVPKSFTHIDPAKNPRYVIAYLELPSGANGFMGGALLNPTMYQTWQKSTDEYPLGVILMNVNDDLQSQHTTLDHELKHYLEDLAQHDAPEKRRMGPLDVLRYNKQKAAAATGQKNAFTDSMYVQKNPAAHMDTDNLENLKNRVAGTNKVGARARYVLGGYKQLKKLEKIIRTGLLPSGKPATPDEKKQAIYDRDAIIDAAGEKIPYGDIPAEIYTRINTLFDELKNNYFNMLMFKNPNVPYGSVPLTRKHLQALSKLGNQKDLKQTFFKFWTQTNKFGEPIMPSASALLSKKDLNPKLFKYMLKILHKNFVENDLSRSDLLKYVRNHLYFPDFNSPARLPKSLRKDLSAE